MLAIERRNRILEKLQTNKKVIVSVLSEEFGVSEETIRRDLDKLDHDGFAVKTYGGAILNETEGNDMPQEFRKKKNMAEKTAIGKILAGIIRDGDHLMIDSSTTAQAMLAEIKDKRDITIITNSIEMLMNLPDHDSWEIISTGGTVRDEFLALVGTQTIGTIENFRAGRAIFSCRGIDRNMGIMDSHEMFSSVKRAMIRCSKQKILVVDSTKFDKIAFSRICEIRDMDIVITGKKPSDEWLALFREEGVECLYPKD